MLSLTHTPACPWILWGLMSSVLLSFLATNMKKYYANITTKKTRCGVTSLSVFIMKIFSTTQIIMAFATGPRVIGHFCHHALLIHSLSSQCIIQKILCIIKMQKMWVIVTFYVFKHKNNFQIITWTTTTSTFKPSVGYRYPGESPTIRWHVCR